VELDHAGVVHQGDRVQQLGRFGAGIGNLKIQLEAYVMTLRLETRAARRAQVLGGPRQSAASGLVGLRSCFLIQGDGGTCPPERDQSQNQTWISYGLLGQGPGPVQGQPLHGLQLLVD